VTEEEEEPHRETQTPRLPIEPASGSQSQGPRAPRPPLQNPWRHFSPPPVETGKGKGKILLPRIIRQTTGPGFDSTLWTTDDDKRRVWAIVGQTLREFQRTRSKTLSQMTNFERVYCGLGGELRWPRPSVDLNYLRLTDARTFPPCGHGLHCNIHGDNEGRPFLRCPLSEGQCSFYYWLDSDGTLSDPIP